MQVAHVRTQGDRKLAMEARSEIENILSGAEQWYASIFLPSRFPFFLISMFLPSGVAFGFGIYLGWLSGGALDQKHVPIWTVLGFVAVLAACFGFKDRL
jgi:hypothetical protein